MPADLDPREHLWDLPPGIFRYIDARAHLIARRMAKARVHALMVDALRLAVARHG